MLSLHAGRSIQILKDAVANVLLAKLAAVVQHMPPTGVAYHIEHIQCLAASWLSGLAAEKALKSAVVVCPMYAA